MKMTYLHKGRLKQQTCEQYVSNNDYCIVRELDRPVTVDEIQQIVRSLKQGKSCSRC